MTYESWNEHTFNRRERERDSEIRNVTNIHIMPKRRKKKKYCDKFLTLDHQCLQTTNWPFVNELLGIVAWSQMQTFAMWRFVNLIVVAHFCPAFKLFLWANYISSFFIVFMFMTRFCFWNHVAKWSQWIHNEHIKFKRFFSAVSLHINRNIVYVVNHR